MFLEALSFTVAIEQTHLCVGKYASPQWSPPKWSSAHLCSPATLASWGTRCTATQTQVLTQQEGENSFLYKMLPWKAANRHSWTPIGNTIWDESSSDFFCHAGRILVPWPGIEPRPSAVKALSPNRWTVREFLFWLFKEHTTDWVDQGRHWWSGNTPGFHWIQCIAPRFISGLDEVFFLPGYIYLWEILPSALPSTQQLFSYPASSQSDTLQAIFLRLSQLPLETLNNDRGIAESEVFPREQPGTNPSYLSEQMYFRHGV